MTGRETIELIEKTCDTSCELVIEITENGERKFYKITRTDEAYRPKGSQYAATLVGTPIDKGEIF